MRFATKFYGCSTAALIAALMGPLAAPARANILVTIDKSTQSMSVVVDGEPRYIWPVSTGRPGYDTPGGAYKINRMDADHFSQEWDNAPMPHTMFFDLHGHAIHGFSDVKHLGLAVSHGCVRLSPDHATTLFDLVTAEGMANTSVVVTGRTPSGDNAPVARARLPENETVYSEQPPPQYGRQPPESNYGRPAYGQPQPGYAPPPGYAQQGYAQPQPVQPQPGYGQPVYVGQNAYGQPVYVQRSYGQPGFPPQPQPYYGQPYRQW